jgi:flagellar hook-basal body complex protein FliE
MTIDALSALRSLALGGADSVGAAPAASAAATKTASSPDFASVLAEVAAEGIQTLKSGEATALAGLQGKASVQEVVQAVMSTEQTLLAAIAIRDKVVAAYQEVSRMAM